MYRYATGLLLASALSACANPGADDKDGADTPVDTDTSDPVDTDTTDPVDTDTSDPVDTDTTDPVDTPIDTGTGTGAGCVLHTDTAGLVTDYTAAFAAGVAGSPAAVSIPTSGTLTVCAGTWHVQLSLLASNEVTGEAGTVFAQTVGSAIQTAAGTTVTLRDIEIAGTDNNGWLIYSRSASLFLDGLTVRGASGGAGYGSGLMYESGAGQQVTVANTRFEDLWIGISSLAVANSASASLTVEGSTLQRFGSRGLGVGLTDVVVRDTAFSSLFPAVQLGPDDEATLERVVLTDVGLVAELGAGAALTLTDTEATGLVSATRVENGASLTVQGGRYSGAPSAFVSGLVDATSTAGTLTLAGATLSGFNGGAVKATPAAGQRLELRDLRVEDNTLQPAIQISGAGTLAISGGVFDGNQANTGAAVYADVASVEIANTVFQDNVATQAGGAVALGAQVANATVLTTTFLRNSAAFFGSAVSQAGTGTVAITASVFEANAATGTVGSALYTRGPTDLEEVLFVGNTASVDCPAWTLNGAATAVGGQFTRNQGGSRGAVCVAAPLTLVQVAFATGADANQPFDVWDGAVGYAAGGVFSGTCAPNQSCAP